MIVKLLYYDAWPLMPRPHVTLPSTFSSGRYFGIRRIRTSVALIPTSGRTLPVENAKIKRVGLLTSLQVSGLPVDVQWRLTHSEFWSVEQASHGSELWGRNEKSNHFTQKQMLLSSDVRPSFMGNSEQTECFSIPTSYRKSIYGLGNSRKWLPLFYIAVTFTMFVQLPLSGRVRKFYGSTGSLIV